MEDVHHVHVWSLDADTTLATAHVVWDGGKAGMAEARDGVRHVFGVHGIRHVTIEVEKTGEECKAPCDL